MCRDTPTVMFPTTIPLTILCFSNLLNGFQYTGRSLSRPKLEPVGSHVSTRVTEMSRRRGFRTKGLGRTTLRRTLTPFS